MLKKMKVKENGAQMSLSFKSFEIEGTGYRKLYFVPFFYVYCNKRSI